MATKLVGLGKVRQLQDRMGKCPVAMEGEEIMARMDQKFGLYATLVYLQMAMIRSKRWAEANLILKCAREIESLRGR